MEKSNAGTDKNGNNKSYSQGIINNYSLNKQMYSKITPPSQEEIASMMANVGAWLSTHYKSHYYMLLNNELHYYTVFNILDANYNKMIQELKECLAFRGRILDIEYQHAEDAYQIWIKEYKTDEVYMFMLFNAEGFVIEVD